MARPEGYRYLKTHEWARIEGEFTYIGLSDYAISHLSDLVFLDLPDVGHDIMQNEPFGEIEQPGNARVVRYRVEDLVSACLGPVEVVPGASDYDVCTAAAVERIGPGAAHQNIGACVGWHVAAGTHAQTQWTSVRCLPPAHFAPHAHPIAPPAMLPFVLSM